MVTKTVQPIRPEDIEARRETVDEATIDKLVETVNTILVLPDSISRLLSGLKVEVYDNSHSEEWRHCHALVMGRFVRAGWDVTSDGKLHYYVGMTHHA